jgi:hypothetical protein
MVTSEGEAPAAPFAAAEGSPRLKGAAGGRPRASAAAASVFDRLLACCGFGVAGRLNAPGLIFSKPGPLWLQRAFTAAADLLEQVLDFY